MSDFSDERLRALYAARAHNDPNTPHPDADGLADAALGHGSEAARLAVFDHALSCASCRRELELLRATSRAGETLQREQQRRMRAALAVAAVLLVAIAIPTVVRRAPRQLGAPAGNDIERGAPAVTASPTLFIVRPQGTVNPGTAPTLVWHRSAGMDSYIVEIVNDTGSVVTRSRTGDTTLAWPSLPSGHYRWRISGTATDGVHWESAFTDLVVRTP
jgi:hypothetical protein